MENSKIQCTVFDTIDSFNRAATNFWVRSARQAINARGIFHTVLTGGGTPGPIYQLLASSEYATQLQWENIHIYEGDERYVPHSHPDSNFGMAKRLMLDAVHIPEENLHPIPTHYTDAHEAASCYENEIRTSLKTGANQLPKFDLIMLGMGADGHTASLFPDTTALDENEKAVTALYVEKLKSWRVTMTYPVFNYARQVMVVVTGKEKARIIEHIFMKDAAEIYPIQKIKPVGEFFWFMDSAAGELLNQSDP